MGNKKYFMIIFLGDELLLLIKTVAFFAIFKQVKING